MKALSSSLRSLALLATSASMLAACSLIADSELADKPASTTGGGMGAAGGGGGAGGNGGAGSGGETSTSTGTVSVCNGNPCLATETCCKGSCVDLDTSTEHCGSCNKACGAGEKCCGGGVCAACCADTDCPKDSKCLNGVCDLQCTPPEVECGTECANLQTSTPHCGSCEIDCLSGHACVDGVCQAGWASMSTSGALSARQRAAAVWTGSTLFVWGGLNDQGVLDDGALYDPKTDTWTPLATANAPTPRIDAVAVLINKRVFVWGGASTTDTNAAGLNSGKFYDLETSTWQNAPISPIGRRNPIATWTGAHVLVWGGISGGSPISGGAIFDPNAMPNPKWTSMSPGNSPSARTGVAWAWSGSELLLFGGRPGGSGASAEGFAYNPATNSWRSLPTTGAPMGRFDAFGGWTGTSMLVYGGRDANNTFSDAFLYTPALPMDGEWAPAQTNPLGKRSAPLPKTGWARSGSSQIVVAGGHDESQTIRLEGQLYDSVMNKWGASIPAWPSGADHEYGVCVWTGTELILWSGLDKGALTAAGDRYRP